MSRFLRSFLLTLALLAGGFVLSFSTVLAAPQINNQINYQARLMDASGFPVADGNYSVKFSLYDAPTAGNRLWTSVGTVGVPTALTVNVQNGLFTVLLGDTSVGGGSQNSLDTVNWNSDAIYLGVTINADAEMSPRKRFASAPQAFNARQLQGMYASSTASGGQTLFTINQTENNAATGTRSALDVRSNGTSSINDFLVRGINDLGSTVFSVDRQGNATTSFLNASSVFVSGLTSSTNLNANFATFATATISGQGICLSNGMFCSTGSVPEADTLQTVTSRGSFTTTTLQLFGGLSTSNLTATGTISLSGLISSSLIPSTDLTNSIGSIANRWNGYFGQTTSTNSTSTSMFANSLSFTTATGTTLFANTANFGTATIAGQGVCLVNGTNCLADTDSLQNAVNGGAFTTTTLQLFGGFVAASSTVTSTFSAFGNVVLGNDTGDSLTVGGRFGSDLVPTTDLTNSLGILTNRFNGYFGQTTSTNSTSTSIFANSLSYSIATGTTLYSNSAVFGSATISGQSVCLANGANCATSGADLNWSFNLAGDFVRNSTGTTDVIIGNTTLANAPFRFDTNTTSSRFIIGQSSAGQTRADVVIGGATSSGMNSAFQLTGKDLFVGGNIGSASSVYTNGEFVVGAASTHYGNGYLTQSDSSVYTLNAASGTRITGNIDASIAANSDHTRTGTGGSAGVAYHTAVKDGYVYTISNNAGGPSFRVYRVSNPDKAVSVFSKPYSLFDGPTAIDVQGKYAYITQEYDGLGILDISNPSLPVQVSTTTWDNISPPTTEIKVSGKYAYVNSAGFGVGTGLVHILDVSNPFSPTTVSSISGLSTPANLAVSGNYLFVHENQFSTITLHSYDISNPASPVLVGSVSTTGQVIDMKTQGSVLYVYNGSGSIDSYNISNPASMTLLHSVSVPTANPDQYDITVAGRYLYGVGAVSGVFVVDIQDPSAMVNLQTIPTSDFSPTSPAIIGNRMYVFDSGASVYDVFRIPGLESGSVDVASADVGKLTVATDAVISNNLDIGGGLSIGRGGLFSLGSLSVYSTNTTSTFFGGVSTTRLSVGGLSVCLANGVNCPATVYTDTLQSVTARGSFTTTTLQFFGGFNAASSSVTGTLSVTGNLNVTGTTSLQDLYFTKTTGTSAFITSLGYSTSYGISATSTSAFATSFGFGTATGTSLFANSATFGTASIGGQSVCLADGTNCLADTDTLQTVTNRGSFTTTTLQLYGGFNAASSSVTGTLAVTGNLNVVGRVPLAPYSSIATGVGPQSVYVQGRYSYVVNYGSATMQIIDVSNPETPVVIGSVATGVNPASVSVQGRYAYVANYGSATMQVIDVSDPASPVSVGTVTTLSFPFSVYVQGQYAYLTNVGADSLQVIDISNPALPIVVGVVATGIDPFSVYVQGRYAYVVSYVSNSLQIIDITNPATPVIVGTVAAATSPFSVYVQGRFAYVANYGASSMQIFDVSNPASPSVVGVVTTGSTPFSVYVQGRYAYVSNVGTDSLQIIDVSNPASPFVVGTVATGLDPASVYVQGRYVYVANYGSATMQVFDLGGAYIQQLEAGGIETGTLSVRNSLQGVDASFLGGLTVGQSANISGDLSASGTIVSLGYVSSTRVLSGGFDVCLITGTNCSAAALDTLQSATARGSYTTTTLQFFGGFVAASSSVTGTLNVVGSLNTTGTMYLASQATSSAFQITVPNPASGGFDLSVGLSVRSTSTNRGIVMARGDAGGTDFSAIGLADSVTSSMSVSSTYLLQDHLNNSFQIILSGAGGVLDGQKATFTMNNLDAPNPGGAEAAFTFKNASVASSSAVLNLSKLGSSGISQYVGSTDPTNALFARAGSIYFRENSTASGTLAYLKSTNGTTTGWVGIATVDMFTGGNITWASATGTNTTSTNLFATSLGFGTATGTTLRANSATLATATISGQSVCLANGANCGDDRNWKYNLAGDFVRNATGTTDVIIGNSTISSAPFVFDISTTSSRLIIGQTSANQTRADVVIGAATSSGMNSLFQLTGQDLFVQGNIGSASSVYTNGAFVAGPGSTYFGNGFINKNDGDLTLSASGALVVASTSTFLGNISFGTSTPIAQLYVPGKVPISVAGSASAGTSPNGLFVQGRYSYVTDFSTKELHILDTSIPSAPVSLGAISTSWIPLDVYVQGQYAYVVTLDPSLRIFDISNPSAPSAVGSIATPGSNPTKVYVQGRYAYVLEQANKTLIIYDISNPVTPVLVGSVGTSASTPQAIVVQGHYAYVITSSSDNFLVIDVSNPSAPSVVGPVALAASPSDISVQGQYAYIVSSAGSTIESFNITNPASPTSVSTTSLVVNPSSIFVQDRYAYVTKFQNLEVVDIADPAAMTSVGVLTMATTPMSVVVEGRYAYSLVNSSALLQTYDLGGAYVQQLEAGGIETDTLSVRNNMQALDGSFLGGLSVAQTSNLSGGLSVVASSPSSTATFVNRSSPSSGTAWGAYIDQLSVGSNTNATGSANYSMVLTYASSSTLGGLCIDDTNVAGNCPIDVGASIMADGAVVSNAFDIAEMYSVTGTAEAGDVLVLNTSSTATVMQSTGVAYDSKVIGIVSTSPGFLLGWSGDTKVALAGRVPVKVSMNNGSIEVGDALVSSDVPGYAMKATRPGMVLGYALEASSATGTAEVFVNVGYWSGIVFDENGAVAIDDAGNVSIAHDLHVGGKFFPSLKGGGLQNDWYLFVNADDASTTYMSTNADGWMSLDTYDFAERYYSPDELDSGDLVVVSDAGRTHVQRSMDEDKMLLGIVSTRPAFIAGRPATSTYAIALSGRVPTKVSNINGAIKAGDPLAPTSIPGVAAKAIHTGPIVGLALEDFENANIDKIEVFVNPGYWVNKNEMMTTAQNSAPTVSSQIVSSQSKRGFATIMAGSKKVRIEFPSLGAYPNVQVTPRGSTVGGWWTENYTDTGFEIILSATEEHDVVFAWSVEATTANDVMRMSDGTYATVDPVTGTPVGWTPAPDVAAITSPIATTTEEIIVDAVTTSSESVVSSTTAF